MDNNLSPEVKKLLENTNLKIDKFVSTLEKNGLPSLSLIEDQLLKIQEEYALEGKLTEEMLKTLENYKKLGVINKNVDTKSITPEALQEIIIDAVTTLEQKRQQRDYLKREIESTDYVNNKQKKQLEDLLESVLSDAEANIVDALVKNLNAENKAMVKTLSSLEQDIKNTTKVSMLERKDLLSGLDKIVESYKETGGLSEKTLSDLIETIKTLEEKGIEISDKDVLSKVIEQSITKNIMSKQYDEVIDTLNNTLSDSIKNSPIYDQLVTGQVSLQEFIKELEKQGEDTTSLLEKINKHFDEMTILLNEMDAYLAETTSLSLEQRKILEKTFREFKEGKLTEEQLRDIFAENGISKDQFEKLLDYTKQVEEAVKTNQLDNADKILQEKRFELLEKTATTLAEVSEEIKAQNSKHFFGEIVSKSNSLEELGENATIAVLDKIFGEDTILDKIFDKFSKKYGGKLAAKLSGLFGNLFSKIKLPKLGGAVSTIARGAGSLLRTGAGLAMRAIPALVSNPVGWAVLGATAVVGAGFAIYNHKYGKDKEIINQLEQQGIVDYSFIGDSEIKDWGKLLKMADDKTLQSLIHFDDWDDKTKKLLKTFYKMKLEDRMKLAEEFDRGDAYIIDGKLHLTKKGIADLATQIKDKKELKNLISVMDDSSKKFAMENASIKKSIKPKNDEMKGGKKPKTTFQKAKDLVKKIANSAFTPTGLISHNIKAFQSLFGGDKYELVERLEDMGVLEHYVIGDSEIKDWDMIQKLPAEDIKKLIEFDDWDDDTMKRLKALYQEKLKQQKSSNKISVSTTGVSHKKSGSSSVNDTLRRKIELLKSKGYTDAHIARYLNISEEEVAKVSTNVPTNMTDKVLNVTNKKDTTNEKGNKSEQNVTMVNQQIIKGQPVREVDLSNYQVATQMGGI